MRIRLDLAYDGTDFEGWQVQETCARPVRTVQGELERALASLYGRDLRIHGAGRTDTGVHADGQVAHLDPPDAPAIPLDGLRRGLNSRLPLDVRVTATSAPPPGWHARFSATGKVYVYRLRRGEILDPVRGRNEALARERLDVGAMREAAGLLCGRRDFGPFSLTGSEPSTTVRTLARLDVEEDGDLLRITAIGDGFLRGMVRRLVGTLRDVGRGRTPPALAPERPGPPAEARGLTLHKVLYAPDELPEPGVTM